MESQPQNPELRINPEYFHPLLYHLLVVTSFIASVSCLLASSVLKQLFNVFSSKIIKY